jgi:Ca2+-binding EF-hand superfamily protein
MGQDVSKQLADATRGTSGNFLPVMEESDIKDIRDICERLAVGNNVNRSIIEYACSTFRSDDYSHLFKTMISNITAEQTVDFRLFVAALTGFTRGPYSSRIQICFRMFQRDLEDKITYQQMERILSCLCISVQKIYYETRHGSVLRERVQQEKDNATEMQRWMQNFAHWETRHSIYSN